METHLTFLLLLVFGQVNSSDRGVCWVCTSSAQRINCECVPIGTKESRKLYHRHATWCLSSNDFILFIQNYRTTTFMNPLYLFVLNTLLFCGMFGKHEWEQNKSEQLMGKIDSNNKLYHTRDNRLSRVVVLSVKKNSQFLLICTTFFYWTYMVVLYLSQRM